MDKVQELLESGPCIPEKRVYTVNEVMEILRISKPTVLKLLKAGRFKAFQIGYNKAWRIPKKSFDAWLDGQTEESEA